MQEILDRTGSDPRAQRQHEALWKWQWLGWRDSTPAFKACLVLLAAMAFAILAYSMVPMP